MLEFDEIRGVLQLARKHGFREVEADVNGISFSAILDTAPQISHSNSVVVELHDGSGSSDIQFSEVSAPCVGYFRQSQASVQVGQSIKEGEVVATIMALGLSNDVEAKIGGQVVDVLVKHEQPVEYGQPLFRLKVKS